MTQQLQPAPEVVEKVGPGPSSTEALVSPSLDEATASPRSLPGASVQKAVEPARPEAEARSKLIEEAWQLIDRLDQAPTLKDRIPIYESAGRRLIYVAAARWPDLMPQLNGDLEIRALLSADLS